MRSPHWPRARVLLSASRRLVVESVKFDCLLSDVLQVGGQLAEASLSLGFGVVHQLGDLLQSAVHVGQLLVDELLLRIQLTTAGLGLAGEALLCQRQELLRCLRQGILRKGLELRLDLIADKTLVIWASPGRDNQRDDQPNQAPANTAKIISVKLLSSPG